MQVTAPLLSFAWLLMFVFVGWGLSTAAARREAKKATRAERTVLLSSAIFAMVTLGAGSIWFVLTDHGATFGATEPRTTNWVPILGICAVLAYSAVGVAVTALGYWRSRRDGPKHD